MKRVRPWLFNGIAVVLPVFGIPYILLQSTGPHETGFGWANNSVEGRIDSAYGVGTHGGIICFGTWHETWPEGYGAPLSYGDSGWFSDGRIAASPSNVRNVLGFAIYQYKIDRWGDYVVTGSGIMLPAWFLAIMFCIPMLVCFRRMIVVHRDRRRANRACCVACGYDLRATPDQCPECGAIPQKAT
jgi:hypothetical protein